MKILNKIKTIILSILGTVFFIFALAMTIFIFNFNKFGVAQFGETSFIMIKTKVSSENYSKGDLVIVESQLFDAIEIGDEVFAYSVAKDGAVSIDFGKVGNKYPEDDAISFENGSTYSMPYVAGTPVKIYPKWGTVLSIITSKWGFLFLVLVPGFLIFIYELYALIVEIKYGSEVY